MSRQKKKPIQYFFVDINDPDYYKRIKVARACIACRARKSKCDIGTPGSGACSSCRKHNKTCEFTATTTTILSPAVSTSSSSGQPYMKRKKNHQQQNGHSKEEKIITPTSFQTQTDFHWAPHQLTLIPFMVPESTTDYKNKTIPVDASQFTVTQRDNHLVGHLRFNLPVQNEQEQQKQKQQHENLSAVTLLPATPPLLLSSHSSSTTTTPSPPLDINHACDATFPWKTSKLSDDEFPKKENFMRSVSQVDPVKSDSFLSTSTTTSSSFVYLQQQQHYHHHQHTLPSESDLFKLYFDRIHPSYPALPITILELRHHPIIPICLRYAIMSLSLLHYQYPIPPTLAHDYYKKACTMMQSRGMNDLVSAQTLLLLHKYHETIGQVKPSLLESTQAILEQQQQQMHSSSSFGNDNNDSGDDKEEWICRLSWLVFLDQFNSNATAWKDLPMMRLPCLLRYEQQDKEQQKVISQFLDSIHIACVYSSAMQNLAIDDPWSSNSFNHDDNTDPSIL